MKKYFLGSVFFTSLILMSCKETVIEYVDKDPAVGYITLSTNKVEIGQKITARLVNIDPVQIYSVTINKRPVTFSQTNESTLTLIAPYSYVGNETASFVFYSFDTVLVSSKINYLYEDDWQPPIFVKWNTGEKLIQSDSWVTDGWGKKQSWSVNISQDTVRFNIHLSIHDECSEYHTLVFKTNGDNNLPKLLYAVYEQRDLLKPAPVIEKMAVYSKVIVDEWNDSLYSGTFSNDNHSWVFWAKH